jgi:hypothetical protein
MFTITLSVNGEPIHTIDVENVEVSSRADGLCCYAWMHSDGRFPRRQPAWARRSDGLEGVAAVVLREVAHARNRLGL